MKKDKAKLYKIGKLSYEPDVVLAMDKEEFIAKHQHLGKDKDGKPDGSQAGDMYDAIKAKHATDVKAPEAPVSNEISSDTETGTKEKEKDKGKNADKPK